MKPIQGSDEKQFAFNGFVITTQDPQNHIVASFGYRGVAYGRAWPLEENRSATSPPEEEKLRRYLQKALMSQPYIGDSYPLSLVTDVAFVQQYLELCSSTGLLVRTLLIATPYQNPVIDKMSVLPIVHNSRLLGFDYVSSDFDYSAVFDDLNPVFSPDIAPLVARINANGLFPDRYSLEEYITARWDFVRSSEKYTEYQEGFPVRVSSLEDDIDLVPCEVYEVDKLM